MKESQPYKGLTQQEVEASRKQFGSNVLTSPPSTPWWKELLTKFKDPLIIILLVAGFLSILISIYEYYFGNDHSFKIFFEPIGIFVAIFLATGLGFLFEHNANKEFALLNKVNDDEDVTVIRNGINTKVAKRDIVVGDIVTINTGDEIPADGLLLESVSLNIDESSLTGEPICFKSTNPEQFDPDATFPTNRLLKGSKVMEGHGIYRVEAVGDATENGKVYEAAQIDNSIKTPLDLQLGRLGKVISYISFIVGVFIILGRMLMYFTSGLSFDWVNFTMYSLQSLMIAVTLIVCTVPEGLPMAVTLSLALSMRRMLKNQNLVRKLHACETMGATTVICTDKTGTLTQNLMQVYDSRFYGLPSHDLSDNPLRDTIIEGIAVNSSAQLDKSDPDNPNVIGNPTEGALLLWLHANGFDYSDIKNQVTTVEELPFSTERKYMATVVEKAGGKRVLYVKGAPEIIYGMCKVLPDGADRESVDNLLLTYQNKAMRTLAFAYQEVNDASPIIEDKKLLADNLTFLGIIAISDPVRADVPDAVTKVLKAGINLKIVTGDTPATAREIGRQIGLWTDSDNDRNIIIGPDFAELTDDELYERVDDIKIIARARPLDKKRLVETLQKKGEIVAVTGDGTNDAPALKAAHVGLSMGDGTSVAKEASDITILDNSFTSIGKAVMWGRSLYQNIQRFILFQMTVNVAACLIVLTGAFTGMESPLTVTQMLWVNLIMDTFAAMALSSLPPSESVMKDKPRKRTDFIISPAMARNIGITGGLISITLLFFLYLLNHTDITSMIQLIHAPFERFHALLPYELSLFFTMFVFMQFWNMFNARAFGTGRSAFHLKGCSEFIMVIFIILIGQIMIVEFGRYFFNVVPLRIVDWLILIGGTSVVLWVGELIRLFSKSR